MSNDSLSWNSGHAPSGKVNYLGRLVDEEGRHRAREEAEEQDLRDAERRKHLNSIEQARIAMNNTVVEQGEYDD